MRPAALWTTVLGALLLFGLIRLPLEESLEDAQSQANLRTARLNIELREGPQTATCT